MDCRTTAGAVSRNDEWEARLSSSRILGFAVGLWELCKNWGRLATLAVVPFTIFATLPHCSPEAESLKYLPPPPVWLVVSLAYFLL